MIECDKHGPNEATFVCSHILTALQTGTPTGFHWTLDDDDNVQAFCDGCWDATAEEWAVLSEDVGRMICLSCLKAAAEINGLEFDPEPYRNGEGET
tara:strand:- start:232 stop:519 length:288 start_codon:yes stop_codon:yes gene_type:complete